MDNISLEISTSLNPEEVVRRISTKTRAISSCLAYSMAVTCGQDSELVGEVNRQSIVVARARPLTHNSSKPVFKARIEKNGSGSIVRGTFEYNCFRKYFFWGSSIILLAAEVFILLGVFAPENQPIYRMQNIVAVSILPLLQVAAYLFTRYVKDPFFADDKKWIESELRRLLA